MGIVIDLAYGEWKDGFVLTYSLSSMSKTLDTILTDRVDCTDISSLALGNIDCIDASPFALGTIDCVDTSSLVLYTECILHFV
jgi:hypothetical protein